MPAKPHQPDPVPMHRRRLGRDRLLRFGVRRQARGPDAGPNGVVAHAELDFGNGRLQLSDPQEAYQIAAPDPNAFAIHSIAFYCPDVDDVVARAERVGATIREPAQTFVTATASRRSSTRSASAGP